MEEVDKKEEGIEWGGGSLDESLNKGEGKQKGTEKGRGCKYPTMNVSHGMSMDSGMSRGKELQEDTRNGELGWCVYKKPCLEKCEARD